MTVHAPCPRCHLVTEVEYLPAVPARFYGHPDNQTPGEDEELEPSQCPQCATPYSSAEIDHQLERKAAMSDYEPEDRP